MSRNYHTKNGRTSKRGVFMNGSWHCDCEPRLPAEKFQTKNGGKNHGRWFYTCQMPQHKRCSFFLWMDDAKVREEAAVLSNSRSEPSVAPRTPQKPNNAILQQPTPLTRPRTPTRLSTLTECPPTARSDGTLDHEFEDDFGWSSSNDEHLAEATLEFETPRKAVKTSKIDSPGKRGRTTLFAVDDTQKQPSSITAFNTPLTGSKSTGSGLLSPSITPAQIDSQNQQHPQRQTANQLNQLTQEDSYNQDLKSDPSTLATEVLTLLKTPHPTTKTSVNLPSTTEKELIDLLNRHDLRTQGIIKGREITRLAVQAKEKKIAELEGRVAALESERETSRVVIAHLKQDILVAKSPKKRDIASEGAGAEGRGGGGGGGGGKNPGGKWHGRQFSRSEV